MMQVNFEKWHGNGNDFVIVNSLESEIKIKKKFITYASNRNKGIGFDQLIKINPPKNSYDDFYIEFFNADGSEAEMCLNGIRCAASYIWNNNFAPIRKIALQTKTNSLDCSYLANNKVNVFVKEPEEMKNINLVNNLKKKIKRKFFLLNAGNNHLCIKSKKIKKFDLQDLYSDLSSNIKEHNINLSIFEEENNKYFIRTFENGVGETLSCGSAALCVAKISFNQNNICIVSSAGGKLKFKKCLNGILMNGATNIIFKGNIYV